MTEPLPGWQILSSDEGLNTLRWIASERKAGKTNATLNSALRERGIPADQAAAFLTQAGLREKARAKFGAAAEHLLFTQAGLEQATRAIVAAQHAERFRAAGCTRVADLGCGLGAESLALLAVGIEPRPVELDAFTASLAAHNLGVAAASAGVATPLVRLGDAEQIGPGDADGVFLDPARRTAGHNDTRRVTSPDDYSPSLIFAFGLAQRFPTGIKLGPGFDRTLIPEEAEAQWVSVDGQVVEMGLWFGAAARSGIRRSALVLQGDTGVHELTAAADSSDVEPRELGEYVYEPDGAVIRARLIGDLATSLGAGMMSHEIAYLTADHLTPTPFAQAFRIVECLPPREKDLRRALRDRGIGSLEIKKRGVNVDPAVLRTRLKLAGDQHATLILSRSQGKHVALLAERC